MPIAKSFVWKDTNIGELYTFLAVTILMASNKKLDMKEYWSYFTHQFSDKYLLLLQMINFCNNENQEKGNHFFKLDVVLDKIQNNFKAGIISKYCD